MRAFNSQLSRSNQENKQCTLTRRVRRARLENPSAPGPSAGRTPSLMVGDYVADSLLLFWLQNLQVQEVVLTEMILTPQSLFILNVSGAGSGVEMNSISVSGAAVFSISDILGSWDLAISASF